MKYLALLQLIRKGLTKEIRVIHVGVVLNSFIFNLHLEKNKTKNKTTAEL